MQFLQSMNNIYTHFNFELVLDYQPRIFHFIVRNTKLLVEGNKKPTFHYPEKNVVVTLS